MASGEVELAFLSVRIRAWAFRDSYSLPLFLIGISCDAVQFDQEVDNLLLFQRIGL